MWSLAFVFLVGCDSAIDVSGVVEDATTRLPISAAKVTFSRPDVGHICGEVETDKNGNYSFFDVVGSGEHEVIVTPPGFSDDVQSFHTDDGKQTLTHSLEPVSQ